MGQTCFYENLRFPAAFCENLRLRNAIPKKSNENLQESVNIGEELRIWLRLSLLVCPFHFPLRKAAIRRCLVEVGFPKWPNRYSDPVALHGRATLCRTTFSRIWRGVAGESLEDRNLLRLRSPDSLTSIFLSDHSIWEQ